MPATTTTKRTGEVSARNNMKWTKTEERNLIRMCRLTDMTPDQMAHELGRTDEAIRYRLLKIFVEHMDGRDPSEENIQDVSKWLVAVGN